ACWQPPGARTAAAARGVVYRRAGGPPAGEGEGRGTAGRAARLPQGWPRGRVHPVLLPWRHLRFRRGAQHLNVSIPETSTRMFAEAAQAPEVVRGQLQANAAAIAQLAAQLRSQPPRAVVTCARGSSDHAATFARYLIETRLGVLTSSAAPSVSSVYD